MLILLALALSQIIPQTPTNAQAEPSGYENWLAALPPSFHAYRPLLHALGLFHIQNTLWFRFLLAAGAWVGLVGLGNQIYLLALQSRRRPPNPSDLVPNTHIETIASAHPPDRILDIIKQTIGALGTMTTVEADDRQTWLHGARRPWTRFLAPLAYLGLLCTICGAAINERWGWRQSGIRLVPQQTAWVGYGQGQEIRLIKVDRRATMATIQGRNSEIIDLGRDKRCSFGFCYQLIAGGGPLVWVSAQDEQGALLEMYAYPGRSERPQALLFTFSPAVPTDTTRLLIVPDYNIIGQLQWQNSDQFAAQAPAFRFVAVDQNGQVLAERASLTAQDEPTLITAQDVKFSVDISTNAMLDVAYAPARWSVILGIALIVFGGLGACIPAQEVWACVDAEPEQATVTLWERARGWGARSSTRQYRAALADLQARLQRPAIEETVR